MNRLVIGATYYNIRGASEISHETMNAIRDKVNWIQADRYTYYPEKSGVDGSYFDNLIKTTDLFCGGSCS